MRPLSLLLTSAAATAALALATPAIAQDSTSRRAEGESERNLEREFDLALEGPMWTIERGPGLRVFADAWRNPDGPAIGVMIEEGGRGDTAGVRVREVVAKSPAEAAGIRAGDRIVAIGDVDLRISAADADDPMLGNIGERRLRRELARHKPGDEVTLRIARDGSTRSVRVKTVRDVELQTAQREARRTHSDSSLAQWRRRADEEQQRRPALGLAVGASGSKRDTLGLFVSRVTTDGPAEKAGIVEGDRIAYINGVDVRVPREDADDAFAARARASRFSRELQKVKPGDRVSMRVYSGGRWRDVSATAARVSDLQRERVGFFMGPDGMGFPELAPMPPLPPMPPVPPTAPRPPMGRTFRYRVPGPGDGVIIYRDGERVPATRTFTRTRATTI